MAGSCGAKSNAAVIAPVMQRRFAPRALLYVSALVAAIVTSSPAHAQTVTGRLLDGHSQRPVMLAVVTLIDSAKVLIDRTFTDDQGRFELTAPRAGSFFVAAAREGYQPKVDGVLELPAGGSISVTFYLVPLAFRLDSLLANARSTPSVVYLRAQGFYERQERGFGHFITPEDLERRHIMDARDLLRGMPGVYTSGDERGTVVLFRSRDGGPPCTPRVYVDGASAASAGAGGNIVIEDFVDVDDLHAVEVYTSVASAPVHYSALTSCGVILFWTRRGR